MSNCEKYGFCPFSKQLTEADCGVIGFCEECDTYFEGYQKGRADKYQEIVSEYMLLTEKQVAELRADAIDDVCKHISEQIDFWDACTDAVSVGSNEHKIYTSMSRNLTKLLQELKE